MTSDSLDGVAQAAGTAWGDWDGLASFFARIDQGFCLCDMVVDDRGAPVDYRFVELNDAFERMTGLQGALGRTALELVPDLERAWIDTYARVGLARESVRFEQGSEAMGRWFDVFATPVGPVGRFAIVFRDETARREAELALERSAERFRTMADELPLIVWLHGPDGEQEFVNLTYCEFFGVNRDSMVGDRWQPFLHPDDADAYIAAFASAVAERDVFHQRARAQDATGRWRWLESWARPRFDHDGTFLGHIGTSADVTTTVAAETAMQQASEFLRKVLDSLFSFVGVLTPEGVLTEANRAPLEIAGLAYDDVIGRPFWDCYWWSYDPDVQHRLHAAVQRAVGGDVVRYDEKIRIAEDGWLWIDFQLVPLTDATGTVTHLIPSGLDITERFEAEQTRAALMRLEQERRWRAEILQSTASRLASAVDRDGVVAAVVAQLRETPGVHDAWVHLWGTVDAHDRPGTLTVGVRASAGESLGTITVAASPDTFVGPARAVLDEIAAQTGQALERAALHEQLVEAHRREHMIAVRLQQALLPDQLVHDDRLPIAARYEAADAHLAVGGDWYDTLQWPDGHIGILVGDVVGHDLNAAATMGRLRSATAALAAALPPDPGVMLDALERVAVTVHGCDFVTAAMVIVDPADGTLRYASAGHPPPLLVTSDASRWLDDAHSPPIGVVGAAARRCGQAQLHRGDTIVMYTDGLVERRDRLIDDGLDHLRAVTARHAAASTLDALLDAVVDEVGRPGAEDDIVVVALRWPT